MIEPDPFSPFSIKDHLLHIHYTLLASFFIQQWETFAVALAKTKGGEPFGVGDDVTINTTSHPFTQCSFFYQRQAAATNNTSQTTFGIRSRVLPNFLNNAVPV
jgi:hypothetical protein